MSREFAYIDDTALKLGVFDQRCFYSAFYEFDNQSIEDSLDSEDLIVRIFAILDRRVGKRRLLAMKDKILDEPEMLQLFYAIRADAENFCKYQMERLGAFLCRNIRPMTLKLLGV